MRHETKKLIEYYKIDFFNKMSKIGSIELLVQVGITLNQVVLNCLFWFLSPSTPQ